MITRTRIFASLMLLMLTYAATQAYAAEIEPSTRAPSQDETPIFTLEHGENVQQLSLAEIESLPLYDTEMIHPEGIEGEFTGVLLNDLLEAYSLEDSERLRFIARDDYSAFLTPQEREEKTYMLLTRLDGEPIPPGQGGPLMLAVPADVDAVLAGHESTAKWIWSLVAMRAR